MLIGNAPVLGDVEKVKTEVEDKEYKEDFTPAKIQMIGDALS